MLINDIRRPQENKTSRTIKVMDVFPYQTRVSVSRPLKLKSQNYNRLAFYSSLSHSTPATKDIPARVQRNVRKFKSQLVDSIKSDPRFSTLPSEQVAPTNTKKSPKQIISLYKGQSTSLKIKRLKSKVLSSSLKDNS